MSIIFDAAVTTAKDVRCTYTIDLSCISWYGHTKTIIIVVKRVSYGIFGDGCDGCDGSRDSANDISDNNVKVVAASNQQDISPNIIDKVQGTTAQCCQKYGYLPIQHIHYPLQLMI